MLTRYPIALIALSLFVATPASADMRSFFAPTVNGTRVAVCLGKDSECGKPAADAYCRFAGYDRSVLFERESVSTSRSLGTGQACSGSECTAFRQVKCFTHKDNFEGDQAQLHYLAAGNG